MKNKAYIKITRPMNCLFVLLTTLLGYWYLLESGGVWYLSLIVGLSALFIAAGGYVINDFYDYEIDKINQPERVLPKGLIALNTAYYYSIMLFVVGIILAILTRNVYCIGIALFNSISLFLYAKSYKKSLLLGNIIVSWNASSTFLYGAVLSSNMMNILPLIFFSFLYTLVREWVKLIEDYDGDLYEKVKSIATIYGKRITLYMTMAISAILIISVDVFSYQGFYVNELRLILRVLISTPLLIYLIILNRYLLINEIVSKIQKCMKFSMLSIVLVFIINDIINIRI